MFSLAALILLSTLHMPAAPTLIDGFKDQSGGMDASRTAEVISDRHFALGINVTARDGMPKTRPMFRRIELGLPVELIRQGYFQGAESYYNPATGVYAVLAAIAGRIYAVDTDARTYVDLSAASGLVNDATTAHYFCQAESFMVINNARDGALIYDGNKLRRATEDEVLPGTIMAVGQGRLWVVSPDFRSIVGGDLAYGGSTATVAISLSTPLNGIARITTAKPHGFTTGDTVTIQRHYASPSLIGTWGVTVLNPTQFTVPAPLTSGSSGGSVLRANDGLESDILRFTEWRFLNEKGVFRLPASMGKIRAATFFAVQDTGTGQGDLLVAGEHGAASFLVSAPRDTWLNIPIERVALKEVGFKSHLGFTHVNSDVFFRASDGLRSYRNARAEFGTYGNTPLSAEVRPLLPTEAPGELGRVSMGYLDSRLLFTAHPKTLPAVDEITPARVVFRSMIALDFEQSSKITKEGLGAYDGAWTGLDVLQLVQANIGDEKRLYAWCWQKQEQTGTAEDGSAEYEFGPRANELWEITKEETGHDYTEQCGGEPQRFPIHAAADLRGFDFGNWKQEKRLTRAEMWIDNIRGAYTALAAYWRPDQHGGGWFRWSDFTVMAEIPCSLEETVEGDCGTQPQIRPAFHVSPFRLGTPPQYEDAMTNRLVDRGFTFQLRLEWYGRMRIKKLLAYAEPLVDPTQGDSTARQLVDSRTVAPADWPQLLPLIGFYELAPAAQCNPIPCVSVYDNATTPRATLKVKLTEFEGWAPSIQVFAGTRTLTRLSGQLYRLQFANGFAIARIDFEIFPTGLAWIQLTPDISDMPSTWIYAPGTGGYPLEACFAQPLEIALDTHWLQVLP